MQHRPCHLLVAAAIAAALLALAPASLQAQTAWTGAGDGVSYADPANWAGGIIPGDGNNNGALIGNSSGQSVIYDTAASYTSTGDAKANSLLVDTGVGGIGSLTLSGNAGTLTFGGNGYGNAAWIGTTTGANTATGTVTVSAGTLSITGASDASINLGVSINSNPGAKSGTLIINGGTVEVGRRLLMGANHADTTGVLTISSGLLDMKRTGSAGEGDLGMIRLGNGTNTLNLDGGTAILSGFHVSAANTARSTIFFNGTTLQANVNTSDFIVGSHTNANLQIKDGGLIMDTAGFNVTINDALSNAPGHNGILVKQGGGILTLSNSGSTFSGDVTVNDGTLSLAAGFNNPNPVNSVIGNATVARTVTVNSGATLEFAANDVMGNAAALPQVNLVVNGGTLTTNGTKFSTLGTLELNGATMSANNGVNANFQAWSLTNTVTVGGSAPSTISTTGSNRGIHLGSSSNNIITFDVANATGSPATDLLVSAPLINRNNGQGGGAGGLLKTGDGTMELTAPNTYTGPTTIDGGTLVIGPGGTISTSSAISVNNSATLRFARNDTWGNHNSDVSSPITVNAGGTLETGGFFNTLRDPTLNGGTIAMTGGVNATYPALALKGTVTVGGTQPSHINVVSGSFNAINIGDDNLGATVFDVADVTGGSGSDLTIDAVLQNNNIAGANSITKTGDGIMELTAANTYTGTTTVAGGTLLINNTSGSGTGTSSVITLGGATLGGSGLVGGNLEIQSGGSLTAGGDPASNLFGTGNLSIGGNLTLQPGSTTTMLLASAMGNVPAYSIPQFSVPSGQNDFFSIGGTLSANGDLALVLDPSYTPIAGDYFILAEFGALDPGSNPNLILPALGHGLAWNAGFVMTNSGYAFAQIVPEPGRATLLALALASLLLRRRRPSVAAA